MGLLDAWSRRAAQRREGKVEFVGDQSGSVEDSVRRELILEFVARPDIQRAYLARVGVPPHGDQSDALCVVSSRPDDRSLVMRVDAIVRRLGPDRPLEILFLDADEESEVARVCSPFYRRPV